MVKKKKSWLQTNLEYSAAWLIVQTLRSLPLEAAYWFGGALSKLVYLLDIRHRSRTLSHIIHSGMASSHGEAARLAKKSIANMTKTAVEMVKLGNFVTEENYKSLIEFGLKPEHADYFTRGKAPQAIIVTGHFGNWELAGTAYALYSGRHLSSVMRPLSNPKIGRLVYARRENNFHTAYPKDNAVKNLLRALRNDGSVAIVADQHASSSEGVETIFFGHPARSHSAPALLHLKTGVPIVVGGLIRTEKGRFRIHVQTIIKHEPTDDKEADIKAVAQAYTSALEAMIRTHPDQWLWAHRRWLDLRNKSGKH